MLEERDKKSLGGAFDSVSNKHIRIPNWSFLVELGLDWPCRTSSKPWLELRLEETFGTVYLGKAGACRSRAGSTGWLRIVAEVAGSKCAMLLKMQLALCMRPAKGLQQHAHSGNCVRTRLVHTPT